MAISDVKALTFDVFGTVVNWRDSIAREAKASLGPKGYDLDWHDFADRWRARYQPAMAKVRNGDRPWTRLDDLHRENLIELLPEFGISGVSAGEIDKAVGDDVEIVLGADVAGLVWAVLQRPADKGGMEAAAARRHEVAIVRRHHHALPRLEIEKGGGAVIGLRLRLVSMGHFRAEDRVPRQAGIFGHVDHQRDIAIRQCHEDVFALQSGQAFDRVRPALEPMPGAVQMVDLGLA